MSTKMEKMVFREGEGDPKDQGRADLVVTVAGGRRLACDVRITNPVCGKVELGHISVPGEVGEKSEREKVRKYENRAKAAGYDFMPCVFSSQGEWGAGFKEWFRQLIIYQNRDFPFSVSNRAYWTRRIAVRLQLGVSNAILTRIRQTCFRGFQEGLDGGGYDIDYQSGRYNEDFD
jgi:hypothetical protein